MKRKKPLLLLLFGVLLFWGAPLAVSGLLNVALASNLSPALLMMSAAALALTGLILLAVGAYELQLKSRTIAAFLGTSQSAIACHYAAWKTGTVREFGGGAAFWFLILVPLALVELVALIRCLARGERSWPATAAAALWLTQAGTMWYLYWIIGGV